MGIYLMPVNGTSKNRTLSLDKPLKLEDVCKLMPPRDCMLLKKHYDDEDVYIWGANTDSSLIEMQKMQTGDHVVDFNNNNLVQILTFCPHNGTGVLCKRLSPTLPIQEGPTQL